MTPAAYVVLGMLRKGAKSGYDIKQAVEISTRFFWTISPAQIYPALQQLERDGLIRGEEAPHGARQRRVFELTEAGERTLAEWVAADGEPSMEMRDQGLLKLFFAEVAAGEAPDLLAAMRRRSEEVLDRMREQILPAAAVFADDHGDPHPLAVLKIGIAVHEAVVEATAALEADLRPTRSRPA